MLDRNLRRWANTILVVGFVLAITIDGGAAFLCIVLIASAFSLLVRAFSAFQLDKFSRKLQTFIWLVGVGMLFLPQGGGLHWLLIALVVSIIVKAFIVSFAGGARRTVMSNIQQATPVVQQPYYSYRQGYQPTMPVLQGHPAVEQPALQSYEQPQAYYPQEMPPP